MAIVDFLLTVACALFGAILVVFLLFILALIVVCGGQMLREEVHKDDDSK